MWGCGCGCGFGWCGGVGSGGGVGVGIVIGVCGESVGVGGWWGVWVNAWCVCE